MHIRYLVGLNRKDWLQEVQGVNASYTAGDLALHPDESYMGLLFRDVPPGIMALLQQVGNRLGFKFIDNKEKLLLIFPPRRWQEFIQLLQAERAAYPEVVEAVQQLQRRVFRQEWQYTAHQTVIPIRSPLLMGIVNVTPDSFSDGGQLQTVQQAVAHARSLVAAGARWIDVGGESTRPGAQPVSATEEWRRIGPVIQELLAQEVPAIISVDTYKSDVARKALEAGAHVINDISAMKFDPEMVAVVRQFQVPVVLMHMKGTPRDMQQNPRYENLMAEISAFLEERIHFAETHGIRQIIVDPGIGFGKRLEDNLEILRRIGEFRQWGYPVLLGASRKSFIGKIAGETNPQHRLGGTLAANLLGWQRGATIFRVHDVAAHQQAFIVTERTEKMKANFRNH